MVIRAVPTTGNTLYRPHRLTSCPEPMEATNSPPIIGNSLTPDSIGLMPFTSWRNRGRKVSAPNMANPTTNPMALAALKTLFEKSGSGITGSTARRSANRNRMVKTTPATASPTINGDVHG